MPTVPAFQHIIATPQLSRLRLPARKRRKLSQTAVAQRLDLNQNRISHVKQHPDELSVMQLLSWRAVIGLELRLGERIEDEPSSSAEW